MRLIKDRLRAGVERMLGVRIATPAGLAVLFEQEHLRRLFEAFGIDCVFDVGANEGQYAQMLRRRARYRGAIVSFEPDPGRAAILRAHAAKDPNWHVEEVALDSDEALRAFHVMADSQFSSLRAPETKGAGAAFAEKNRIERDLALRTRRLEDYVALYKDKLGFARPFLKLDTQGHDLAVATGAGAALSLFLGVQTEMSVQRLYQGAPTLTDSLSFFQERGFELSAFVPNNGGHFPKLIEIDGIFIASAIGALDGPA